MARERFYGNDAIPFLNVLTIKFILQKRDFIIYIEMLKEVLEALYLDPHDYPLVFIVPSDFTLYDRKNLQFAAFKYLSPPKLTFLESYTCALSYYKKATGVVIDIGHLGTRIDGLFKGFPNAEAHMEIPIGGYHITKYLVDLMFPRLKFQSAEPLFWIAESIKRQFVKTAIERERILSEIRAGSTEYDKKMKLPDGTVITLNKELYESVEPLFSPSRLYIQANGITEQLVQSIRTWERSAVPDLLNNILLVGNGGLMKGLVQRIEYEIRKEFNKVLSINVSRAKEPKDCFWYGAQGLVKKAGNRLNWIENPLSQSQVDETN